jgi:hypothetical protein
VLRMRAGTREEEQQKKKKDEKVTLRLRLSNSLPSYSVFVFFLFSPFFYIIYIYFEFLGFFFLKV